MLFKATLSVATCYSLTGNSYTLTAEREKTEGGNRACGSNASPPHAPQSSEAEDWRRGHVLERGPWEGGLHTGGSSCLGASASLPLGEGSAVCLGERRPST